MEKKKVVDNKVRAALAKTDGVEPGLIDPESRVGVRRVDKKVVPFEPSNVNEAWHVAKLFSESGLVPTPLRGKPQDILVVLMTGRELGMTSMQSLRSLHVIEGRASMSAQMMVAALGEDKAAEAMEKAVMFVTANKLKSMQAGKMGYSTSEVGDLVAEAVAG